MSASLEGTMRGMTAISPGEREILAQQMLLAQEQDRLRAARAQEAEQQAQQTRQAYEQALATPTPGPGFETLIPQALGQLASLIGQSPEPAQRGRETAKQNRAEILQARQDNLKQLQSVSLQRAEEAKQAGDLEAEQKSRREFETLNKALDAIQTSLDRQARVDAAGAKATAGTEDVDPNAIAEGIMRGDLPPIGTNLGRGGLWGKVSSVLAKKGYNLNRAQQDLYATRRHWAGLNSTQQQRLRQATQVAYDSLELIDNLSAELSSKVPRGRFPILNKAAMRLAMGGALGPEAQQAANNLNIQILDLQSELAQVYRGGYAPTNEALKQAVQQLKGEWSEATLKKATELARANLQIRLNSIAQTTPITPGAPGNPAGDGLSDDEAYQRYLQAKGGK